jgi:hypothetical protein
MILASHYGKEISKSWILCGMELLDDMFEDIMAAARHLFAPSSR